MYMLLHSEILHLYFLSDWMEYDGGDSFPLDFEQNRIPFGSKSTGKQSPPSAQSHLFTLWLPVRVRIAYEGAG